MPDSELSPGEQSIALTRDFRLIQKLRGHRYSVDDMLVAHHAATRCVAPQRALDLGCGLGSVLLIGAWAFPRAQLVGLERLPEHVTYARRNVRLNGCQQRVAIVAGDLRDQRLLASLGSFDLVTGSPPYFDPRSGTLCQDAARAAAHFELCGGIEAYAAAAAQALRPGGCFVSCAGADPPGRALGALQQAGLCLLYHQPVLPRAGKRAFLSLLVGAKGGVGPARQLPPLVLRREDGRRTEDHLAIREWTGVPPRRRES